MIKKVYITPVMRTVELKHRTMILTGSVENYGMNKRLQTTEQVDDGF